MARQSRNDQIVSKMEALALTMLERVGGQDEKITLDLRMDVFERVGKWIAIRNKLENDDGGGIADYKRRLHGEGAADKHPAGARRSGRAGETGGARLAAIKSRIPAANAGGDDGDSGAAGGEVSAAAEEQVRACPEVLRVKCLGWASSGVAEALPWVAPCAACLPS